MPNLLPTLACTPSNQPSPGPLLRVLDCLRDLCCLVRVLKFVLKKVPELLQVIRPCFLSEMPVMVRKHSPRRCLPSGPKEPLSTFQRAFSRHLKGQKSISAESEATLFELLLAHYPS